MSGVSAQEYRFSSKAASQLASLACCRCVQKTCAAKNVWGSTCELDFLLQACQYIKNLKKLGIKAIFFHEPGPLKQPGWAVLLHSSQPRPEQQFSCEGFPTTLTSTAWRQEGLSMVWDGWAHTISSSGCLLLPHGEVPVFRVWWNMNPGRDFNLCFWIHDEMP